MDRNRQLTIQKKERSFDMIGYRVEYVTDICILGFAIMANSPEEAIDKTAGDFLLSGATIEDINEIRVKRW